MNDYPKCNELYPDHLTGWELFGYMLIGYLIFCALAYGICWLIEEINYRKMKWEWRDTPKNRKRKGYE